LKVRIALTRPVPSSLERCELTHLTRTLIDVALAIAQHRAYEETLRALGCAVRQVAAADDCPDSVFVEDVAIVLDEVACVTRPGAASRRAECESVARVLAEYRPLRFIEAPGTLDGGDVLRLGRRLFVGLSTRTNEPGARQLATHVEPFGYAVECVRFQSCLHLKSAATALDDECVICNPEWIAPRTFNGQRTTGATGAVEVIEISRVEPYAANVLRIGRTLVCSAAHPETIADLRNRGYAVRTVEMSEFANAEGAVTCCSLIIE
jgi:dimethylargininase